ncbi:hypothetical protein [Sphingobium aquiterrae]|uniref:hypothetical protein n=1 Tax=Sphingobium aquiterrae TaxID=2038656 RepID=UPI003018951C
MSHMTTANHSRWGFQRQTIMRKASFALAFTLLVPGAFLAAQDSTGTPGATAPVDNTALIAALVSTLRSELSRFTPESTVEDVEASIIFVLNQQEYDDAVVNAAFDQVVATPGTPDNVKQAIENIRRRLGRLARGTGALGGGDGSFSGVGFSGPVIGVGGGGSNYSQ